MTRRRIAAGLLTVFLGAEMLAGCAAPSAADPEEAVRYDLGKNGPEIDVQTITSEQELPGYLPVAESGELTLFVNTKTTEIAVADRAAGTVWYSNPPAAADDPIATPENKKQLQSQVAVSFFDKNNTESSLLNYDATREHGRYGIRNIENGVAVSYVLGNFTQDLLVPPAMTEERYQLFYNRLSDEADKAEMRKRFRKVTLSTLDDPNEKAELLADYPSLGKETLYIKYEMKDYVAQRLAEILAEAGYTAEDYELDSALAAKGSKSTRARFTLTVEYTLEDGALQVRVPVDSIRCPSEFHVNMVSVLPVFGAAGMEETGYMLVPDGSGGLINLNNGKISAPAYTGVLYSPDYSKNESDAPALALYAGLPVFGMKRGDTALLAVIEGAAASARIRADVSGKQNAYNTIYPQFTVLDNALSDMGSMAGDVSLRVYQPAPISQDIQVRYQFLHGEDGNYSGMARAYRSYLQKKEGLAKAKAAATLPMLVDLVGSMEIPTNVAGVPVDKQTPLTTFSEAESILHGFLDAGVENLSARYLGWYNRGLNNVNPANPAPVSELGGKKGLNSLLSFAEKQGVSLYLGSDLLYLGEDTAFDGLSVKDDTVRFMDRGTGLVYGRNPVTMKNNREFSAHFILSPRGLPTLFSRLSGKLSKLGKGMGVSLLGMNRDVNSDFNRTDPLDRGQTVDLYREVYAAAREAGYGLLMDGPNDYGFAYADAVAGVPYRSSEYRIVDESVPFVQMVLSGSVSYYAAPVNLGSDFETDCLRMAETGSGMYALLTESFDNAISAQGGDELFSTRCAVWKERLTAAYAELNAVLGEVQGLSIREHRILAPGVRATIYESGRAVVVNYTNEAVNPAELDGSLPDGEIAARSYRLISTEEKKEDSHG